MPADALPNFANCDGRARVIAALDDVAAELKAHVQKPYHFRFPSQLQAKPFEQAFYKWVAGGRVGPQPPSDPASLRAAMYNQSTTASALAAFHRVMCVISVEFAESSADGFRKGQLTVPCAALRSLIERIAHTVALSDAVKGMPTAPISPVCTVQYAVVDDSLRQRVRNSYLALEPDEEAFRQYLTKLVAHSQGPFGLRRWKRKKNSNGDL
jgi:hypothetical protein